MQSAPNGRAFFWYEFFRKGLNGIKRGFEPKRDTHQKNQRRVGKDFGHSGQFVLLQDKKGVISER